MKVFIAGATGVLGRRLVNQFTDAGHSVVGLTRDLGGDNAVEDAGGTPHRGDVFEKETLREGAAGADVVVHAATALPTKTKTTAADWERNDQVRLTGARNLLDVATEVDADQFVLPSVVWAVRAEDGSEVDEESPPNTDRTTESAVQAENVVRDTLDGTDVTGTILRMGWLYGPESGQTRNVGETLVDGDLPVVGSGLFGRGETTVSLLHMVDAARAVVAAVEADAAGPYHVVDDEPVTTSELFEEFAARLDVEEPGRVPPWLAKLFVGADMVRFMTNSFPTSNGKFRREVGWEPMYPSYRQGLDQVVRAWRAEGEIVEEKPRATA